MAENKCSSCAYKKPETVSVHVLEIATTGMQVTIKRLIAVIVLLVCLFVGSNLAWIIYENQFVESEVETFEVEHENESGDNFAVNGDMTYGEAKN